MDCIRKETSWRVLFIKKKKVSNRCIANKMTVKHEGDCADNRAVILLVTLRDITPLNKAPQVTSQL